MSCLRAGSSSPTLHATRPPPLSGRATILHPSAAALACLFEFNVCPKSVLPIGTCADDEDNFVVGLGVDLTCTSVAVQHPTDPTAPDLPAQPVLLVGSACVFNTDVPGSRQPGGVVGLCSCKQPRSQLACIAGGNRFGNHRTLGHHLRAAPHCRWPPQMACCGSTPLDAWTAPPAAPPPASSRRPSHCLRPPRWPPPRRL